MTSLTTSGLWADGQRLSVQGQANGSQDRYAAPSGGLEHGSDVGVEARTPVRAEAVGDFAEDDAGTQRLFRAVVRRRQVPVGDEDEQVLAEALDDPEQLQPLLANG